MFHYKGVLNHNNGQEKAFIYRRFDLDNAIYTGNEESVFIE